MVYIQKIVLFSKYNLNASEKDLLSSSSSLLWNCDVSGYLLLLEKNVCKIFVLFCFKSYILTVGRTCEYNEILTSLIRLHYATKVMRQSLLWLSDMTTQNQRNSISKKHSFAALKKVNSSVVRDHQARRCGWSLGPKIGLWLITSK